MDRRDIFERDIVFSLQKSPTQGSGTPSNPWTASTSPGDRASIAINRTGRLVVQGSLVVGFMRSQESGGGDSITGIAEGSSETKRFEWTAHVEGGGESGGGG